MIGYVKGIITEKTEDMVYVECQGVGYEVMVPYTTLVRLPSNGSEIKLYTFHHVKEDAQDLYGFLSKEDLLVFKLLISVSGIGPRGGLSILSLLSADELKVAVISQDAKTIQRANGIGSKTAQRVIIDLKDKFSVEDVLGTEASEAGAMSNGMNSARDEAIEALTSLGYSASESLRAVSAVGDLSDMDSEGILKEALKKLAFI